MIYDVKHTTTYTHDSPVASSRCVIRLIPRTDADQRVLNAAVEVTPSPETRREIVDFFGNRVIEARVVTPHAKLRIAMSARVDVRRSEPPAIGLTPRWEIVARAAAGSASIAADSPAHFIFASRLVPIPEPIVAYARKSFPDGRPVLEGAAELMKRIYDDFKYDPKATDVTTPLAEAFAARRGVCQDFAHVMIAGLRGIGLPAAYVSGYIRTIPPEGQPRLEGADASHAWIAVWCGPEFGWLQLDPTNDLMVVNDHIVVAIGRDYADVSPVDGVILGAGGQDLDVAVEVKAVAPGKSDEVEAPIAPIPEAREVKTAARASSATSAA